MSTLAAVTYLHYCPGPNETAQSTERIRVTVQGADEKLTLQVDNASSIGMAVSGVRRIFWGKEKLFLVYDPSANASSYEARPTLGKKIRAQVVLVNSTYRNDYMLDQLEKAEQ